MMPSSWRETVLIAYVILLVIACVADGKNRKGHLIGRYKGRKYFKPITGKYPTDEAYRYYTNPKGAKIIKSSHFHYQYVLGHKIVFLCVARGIPIPQITWFKDGVELYAHRYMQLHEWRRHNRLKSKMEIDPATQAEAGIYECHANNKFAVDRRAFRATYSAEFP
ncbi:unnamed protein product [Meganyctiphanes norvegica]|uniref:Ig-like domain-containing protein n=1 Tax=Meganyctiphanes norvegica TaxID=48144 RepID=A0AAV2Q009_MEGNR